MKIKLGMVGGGTGAFIGEVHRIAARLDNRYELVAGAFSSDAGRAKQSAEALGIELDRAYADFSEMAKAECAREDGIDVVAIVTPNYLHHAPAKCFLEAGIHVICDKPLTSSLDDALDIKRLVDETGLLFAVTYNYSGYPMVRQAREMIRDGDLGTLRVVQVEYAQEWLSTDLEFTGQKQAAWRMDPVRAGSGGSLGDIGTHAFHLAEFITGLEVKSLLADLSAFVSGRLLDDNAQIMLRFTNGAKGSLWASQVAVGHENGLRIRIYGDQASLEWFQEQPNQLKFCRLGANAQYLTRGGVTAGSAANSASRIPGGHPEGFLEAFANLYRDFADRIECFREKNPPNDVGLSVPSVAEGVKGVQFVEKAVASSENGGVWLSMDS